MRINSHHFPHETTWKVVTYMDARLEPYRTLVSFLGEALGPDYEVVLHDLTSEEGTIAAIVNNNISGRTEGAPLSNMALRFIHGKVYEKQPYVAGYQGASQAKGRLRSSTMFIKDGSELIGMLCINFDAAKYSRMAQELLAQMGLSARAGHYPHQLSGGQQQRVAIARALVSKPSIVLADEPTGNLDSKTSADVLGLLKTTSQKFHQTIVMITHNNEIAQLADRIIRIEDGKIVQ